jgi:hypothetical protein
MPRGGSTASTSTPPTPTPTPTPAPKPDADAPTPETPRYHGEVSLGETPISALARAVDSALARTVVIERFSPGQPDATTERRLLGLAAALDPHLQLVLAYDRASRTVTLEAPVGETLSSRIAAGPLAPRDITRILAQVARALAPVHAAGIAHGAVTADRILLDDTGATTLCVAGLGPADAALTPATDVQALLAIASTAAGSPGSALLDALAAHLPYPTPALPPLPNGSELAHWAASLDGALARAARAAAHVASLVEHAWHLEDAPRAAALREIRLLAAEHALPPTTIDTIVR